MGIHGHIWARKSLIKVSQNCLVSKRDGVGNKWNTGGWPRAPKEMASNRGLFSPEARSNRKVTLPPPVPPQDLETARWFADHLQPHEAMLRAWLHSRFPQIGDLDDIIQESYARVLAVRTKREVHSPKAFFFATARNLAYDHFRKLSLTESNSLGGFDDLGVLDDAADVSETVARNQEIELMTQAIQSLPDRCRQVMTLRNVYGLSHKEIAEQLGISVRTVEAQLTTGIKRCTRLMAKFRCD